MKPEITVAKFQYKESLCKINLLKYHSLIQQQTIAHHMEHTFIYLPVVLPVTNVPGLGLFMPRVLLEFG